MTTHVFLSRSCAPARSTRTGDFDRLFDALWRGLPFAPAEVSKAGARRPRIDVQQTDAELRVSAELPGVEREDIEVSLDGDVLAIRGQRAARAEGEAIHRESPRGHFERSLRLPAWVDPEGARAVYRRGVVTVTLPRAKDAGRGERHIPVRGPGES